ncbi:histidine kinase [Devosia soli]|uniref:Blue-light-activated histidine kinase n=1 Tax=Devosia soli TaxID=361041 RepID=A0A0F5L7S7_9HYPH|nr:PAS domain S-box protein [Devosia soli]KKB78403.1 histidine kinase [Devosia soli]
MNKNQERIEVELHKSAASNDPFAAAVRATRMPMLITDPDQPDNPIVFLNDAFTKLTGYTRDEVLGKNCRFLQGAATNADDVTRVRNAIARREPIEIDLLNYRKDGSSFWNRLLISPVFDENGHLTYFFASQFDVSPDRNRLAELQMSQGELESEVERRMLDVTAAEARLRFILQAAGMGVWTLDLKSKRLVVSARFKAIFGRAPGESFSFDQMLAAFDETHRLAWQQAHDRAVETGEEVVVECRLETPLGESRWVELRGQVSHDLVDEAAIMSGVGLDITERKEAEEHRKLLARELSHRVKNTLATAQAVFVQSLKSAESVEDAQSRALGRVQALASAQDLLTQEGWSSATLRDVVEKSIFPFHTGNIRVAGPRLMLGAKAVSTLSLALHELATNSVKYGSLSTENGSVTITWTLEQGDEPSLHFYWSEMGGPKVEPPKRRGFGSRVVEQIVQAELKGHAAIEFRPDGLKYEILAPVSALIDDFDPYSGRPTASN